MKKIIYQHGTGIGDWLSNSTLPEMFHKQGYEVYLYDNLKDLHHLSSDVLNLIMLNPYIKGFTTEEYNCGDVDINGSKTEKSIYDKYNCIQIREYENGLDIKNTAPIIYYHPNFRVEFSDKIVIDLNCKTEQNNYNFDNYKNWDGVYLNPNFDTPFGYFTKDIFEYIDIIYSCKEFKCLHSGSLFIASVIKRFRSNLKIDVYMPNVIDNRGTYYRYFLSNVNYDNDIFFRSNY
jgi:hypothetical protein